MPRLQSPPFVLWQFPRQVHAHRVLGTVLLAVLGPLREVEARVPGAEQDAALLRVPGQAVDSVAQEDRSALGLLHAQRQ